MYIYTNLPVNAIVRLPHPQNGDRQGQETFLSPSANKQTRNYDSPPSCQTNYVKPPSLPINPKVKKEMVIYIYIYVDR